VILVVTRLLRLHEPTQRQRHVHERLVVAHHARERLRRHADDRQGLVVDRHRLADDIRIPGEIVLPVLIAQHGDERFADPARVLRADEAADLRPDIHHVEVVSGHEDRALELRRVLADLHAREERVVRRDAGKRFLRDRQVAIHRIAEEPLLLADGQIAARRAELLARRAEGHERVDVRRRDRLQDFGVDQRVDRRRGADPDREHRYDGRRQRGT
jgi:hypothetical protein